VRTITTIYPNIPLLETAASHIARFVSSENHNLKYLGIKALALIVQVNQKYALDHQMVVVECLEDPDETLKRKTLDLLFAMTNATNVVFVTDTLVSHLRATTDVAFRTSLVERLTQLAERYAPDNAWYIRTMNSVFELGGELVRNDIAHNLMRLIAEGSGEDEDVDMELRRCAPTRALCTHACRVPPSGVRTGGGAHRTHRRGGRMRASLTRRTRRSAAPPLPWQVRGDAVLWLARQADDPRHFDADRLLGARRVRLLVPRRRAA
jgi:hypothetical protein